MANSNKGVTPMVQKLDIPKTESELNKLLDKLYLISKENKDSKKHPCFKGLLEIIQSDEVILTAIHKIKANKGSNTKGTDGETIDDILQDGYESVISRVRKCFLAYNPKLLRRVHIDKQGSKDNRPLGIPAIIDRIIQECIRMIIEPILEAQFFSHSYGFRPYRSAEHALSKVTNTAYDTNYCWVVEGDIKKFFDNVNHTILIKKLYSMGIRDRRVLMIIKAMLQCGVLGEAEQTTVGTPQGGIISPLLANAYLDSLDHWITREWENKETKYEYSRLDGKYRALKNASNLKPAHFVRYADDWVLITNSKANAIKWKQRIAKYLKAQLKLELSEEKTLITNIKKKAIKFVGFHFKQVKNGKGKNGWVTRTEPDPKRLEIKIQTIRKTLKAIKRTHTDGKREITHSINKVNSQIRGVIQYYEIASRISKSLEKYANNLRKTGMYTLSRFGATWTPANETNNLMSVHEKYKVTIPTIEIDEVKIGLTDLYFSNFKQPQIKSQKETPYTPEGRMLYFKRLNKRKPMDRMDGFFSERLSEAIGTGRKQGTFYNFEYYMNRPYTYNRDKGKCKICGDSVSLFELEVHHINPKLPLNEVNKVRNLASLHMKCHKKVTARTSDISYLSDKIQKKIIKFRKALG